MTDARGRSPKKKKVTREQWLVLALKTLAAKGIDAVKIDLEQIADLTNRLSSRALVSSLITLAYTVMMLSRQRLRWRS